MVTLIGSMVVWGGYLFLTYGYSQVRGCNTGLRDLAWPGRAIACSSDQAAGGPAAAGPSLQIPKANYGGLAGKNFSGVNGNYSGLAGLSGASGSTLSQGISAAVGLNKAGVKV